MKRLVMALLAATSLSAGSGQIASAADLPMKAPPLVAAPIPFSWAGFYVGVNAGYAWGNNDTNVSSTPVFVNTTNFGNPLIVNTAAAGGTASLSPDNGAFIGGIQAGYNWQFNSIVAGIEADFQGLAGNNGSGSTGSILAVPGSGNPLTTTMSASQQVDWLGTRAWPSWCHRHADLASVCDRRPCVWRGQVQLHHDAIPSHGRFWNYFRYAGSFLLWRSSRLDAGRRYGVGLC